MHAVGPIYSKSFPAKNKREATAHLTKVIINILNKANELEDVKSVSLPTFVNGFPLKKCAQIVLQAIVDWCKQKGQESKIKEIRVCDDEHETHKVF